MEFMINLKKIATFITLLILLSACDGGGGKGGNTVIDTTAPEVPSKINISRDSNGAITVTGLAEEKSTVTVTFPDGSTETAIADDNGLINFTIESSPSQPAGKITVTSTDAAGNTSESAIIDSPIIDTTAPEVPSKVNISTDTDGAITVTGLAEEKSTVTVTFPDGSTETAIAGDNGLINFTIESNPSQPAGRITVTSTDASGNTSESAIIEPPTVTKSLYLATGTMPALKFTPSLGVNTEAPQGGVDTAGMPMPFVDIFRTARPFKELSPSGTEFDDNGWPIQFAAGEIYAKTKLLQGALDKSLPEGKYTVLYDGSGNLEFSGSTSNVQKIPNENKYTFDLTLNDFDGEDEVAAADTNAFNMNIKNISSGDGNYIKNIRIIMPGGTCTGNPYIRVDATDTCPDGTVYESFEERLLADRNAIIFNPEYLSFLRNFKVIRMMNLMEASLKKLCYSASDCPASIGTWSHRAKLTDSVWGGNDGRTADIDHKGVPVEVMVELANTLNRDIWVNMPHVATDEYIENYADYVKEHLNPSLKVYLEYANEVWNNGFAGHDYAVSEGIRLGLNDVPAEFVGSNRDGNYFARLRFYSQRAIQVFDIWDSAFGGNNNTQLIHILGSFIGDKVLTEQMLKHVSSDISKIDAVAIAPYFFGCPYEEICANADKTLLKATTVDDIFDILDQPGSVDVKSIDGTIDAVKKQLTITKKDEYNLKLITYEGGQHLVTGVLGNKVTSSDKIRLRKLFNQANRDPRMKERYISFLNAWKDLSNEGTTLFTLYTLPQSFYRHGNFGIKEHLNKPRSESPKFDGAMTFQESVEKCWWDEVGCTP